jgi:hypothetical protein
MFLTAYHYEGDPIELTAAHRRSLDLVPPGVLTLHIVILTDRGISVFDECPSREVAAAVHDGPEFHDLMAAAGLPSPRIEPLGDIESTIITQATAPR